MEKPIDLYHELKGYIAQTQSEFELKQTGGVYFSIANTGQRGGGKKWFNIGLPEILHTLGDIKKHLAEFLQSTRYAEKEWRDLGGNYFTNEVARSLITVQTKPFFTMLAKLFQWANEEPPSAYTDQILNLSAATLENTINKLTAMSAGLTPDSIVASLPEVKSSEPQPAIETNPNILQLDEAFEAAVSQTGFATN